MTEKNGNREPLALIEEDELAGLLAVEDEDLDDDLLDLEDDPLELGDTVVVEQFVPDPVDVGGTALPELEVEPEVDLDLDLEPDVSVPAAPMTEERLARLEDAARALAQAERDREQGRVRRKVTAAGTGAGAVGVLPIVLQLAGALDLDPELAAAISTVAAALGALVVGWATPERRQVVTETRAAQDLLGDVA